MDREEGFSKHGLGSDEVVRYERWHCLSWDSIVASRYKRIVVGQLVKITAIGKRRESDAR